MQTFGNALESKLQEIAKAAKNQKELDRRVQREFDRWISSADPKSKSTKGRFRDPMAGGVLTK